MSEVDEESCGQEMTSVSMKLRLVIMFAYLAAKTFFFFLSLLKKKTAAHTGDEPTSIFRGTTGSYGGGLGVTSDGNNCFKTTMAAHHESNIAAIASILSEMESVFH